MTIPLLSTCMIVRNEEDFLERCLASIRPFTDELIVVDTGSTDGTIAIAEGYADRLIHHPWADDFSAARNRSIADAAGEWIFYIDADEELPPGGGKKLCESLDSFPEDMDHLYLMIRNLDGTGGILSEFPALRLFRNGRGIRFEGIVHNQVICRGAGGTLPIALIHYGYALTPEKMEQKFQRTFSLTKKQIAEEPNNPFYYHNLALSLLNHEDHAEAVESGLTGLQLFRNIPPPYPPLFSNLIYLTARSALAEGRHDLAAAVCREGLKVRPDHLDLFWVIAMASFKMEQYHETLKWGREFHRAIGLYRAQPYSELPVNTIGQIAPLLVTTGYAAAILDSKTEAEQFMDQGLLEGQWDPEIGIRILNFCKIHEENTLGTSILQELLRRRPDHPALHRFRAEFSSPVEPVRTPSAASFTFSPRKVLIINLCEFGDLVQATPLIEEFASRHGAVTLLVRKDREEIARRLPGVSRIVPFEPAPPGTNFSDREITKQIGGLLREPFDLLLNVTYTPLGAQIARMAQETRKAGMIQTDDGNLIIRGESIGYLKQMTAHRELNSLHVVDLHRLLLHQPLQKRGLSFQISEKEWAEAMEILQVAGITSETPLMGIQAGARDIRKRWPVESFTHLVQRISAERPERILLFGAASEAPLTERIEAAVPERIVNLTGRTTIAQMAALLSRCRVLISNDSGTSHLAAAVGTRVLSLHMGHVFFRETAPYGEGHVALQAHCECAPCSPRRACREMPCRKIITPAAVDTALRHILDGSPLQGKNLFPEIEVYESYFDAANFLSHRPLTSKPPSFEDFLREVYGRLWKRRLTGSDEGELTLSPLEIFDPEEIVLFLSELSGLEDMMEEARSLAGHLSTPDRREAGISGEARRFRDIHETILERGRKNRFLRPITEFYNIAQQQIETREFPAVMESFCKVLGDSLHLLEAFKEGFPAPHSADRSGIDHSDTVQA